LVVAEPTPETPRRALLKSAEVCDMVKVQPYVLRSWEKEFPDLGTTRTAGGPRFYRPSDVERVQRLKQLVFGEGLTIAGARRRLEEERGAPDDELPFDDAPAGAIPADARQRLDGVRRGLQAILAMLSEEPSRASGANGGAAAAATPAEPEPSGKRRRGNRSVRR
jgi:DNA-binding transcriptional MerR regulator